MKHITHIYPISYMQFDFIPTSRRNSERAPRFAHLQLASRVLLDQLQPIGRFQRKIHSAGVQHDVSLKTAPE